MNKNVSSLSEHAQSTKRILAVIVLHKMPAEQSPSFSSLQGLSARNRKVSATIDVVVCDNTPYDQPRPPVFQGLYISDKTNPGLAKCYNLALRIADEREIPWLLLLDQDTTLTREYSRRSPPERSICSPIARLRPLSQSCLTKASCAPACIRLPTRTSPDDRTHDHRRFFPALACLQFRCRPASEFSERDRGIP